MRRRFLLAAIVTLGVLGLPTGAVGSGAPAAQPVTASAAHHWTMVSSTSNPSARDQSVAAYDPQWKATILFGGYDFSIFAYNDTWEFSGGVWTNISSIVGTGPGQRWAAALQFDPALHGLVLFGGRDVGQFYNDLWLLNTTGWQNITPAGGPSPRSGVSMAYDNALGEMIVYGGGIGNLPAGTGSPWTYYNETWVLKGRTWTNATKIVGPNPGERFDMRAVYDPHLAKIVAFGGFDYNPTTSSGAYASDTWTFAAGRWTKLGTVIAPGAGTEAGGMAWFPQCRCAVFFGGGGRAPLGNQTWTFSGVGVWRNLTAGLTTLPPARANIAFAADVASGELVLFGGDEAPPLGAYVGDSWTFR